MERDEVILGAFFFLFFCLESGRDCIELDRDKIKQKTVPVSDWFSELPDWLCWEV